MGNWRKRHNRSLKRKIDAGIISEENAKAQFRHGATTYSKPGGWKQGGKGEGIEKKGQCQKLEQACRVSAAEVE